MVTSHDAFGYRRQPGFIAPQGLSTHDEPSAADVAALIRQLREEGVRAVFVENIVIRGSSSRSPKGGRHGRRHPVLRCAGQRRPASTYLGMFEHNLDTLMQALQP